MVPSVGIEQRAQRRSSLSRVSPASRAGLGSRR
jgi:hypothetical protein